MRDRGRREWAPRASPRFPRCACGKVSSPTEEAARATFRFAASFHPPEEVLPVTFYVCRYGAWHWTRIKPRRT